MEAVRHALFSTADKSPVDGAYYFGNGLLRAKDALGVVFRDDLPHGLVERDARDPVLTAQVGGYGPHLRFERRLLRDLHDRDRKFGRTPCPAESPSAATLAIDRDSFVSAARSLVASTNPSRRTLRARCDWSVAARSG